MSIVLDSKYFSMATIGALKSQNIATVDLTVVYTVTKFQNLAHCNGFGQMVAMQVSQSDNFLVVIFG
jgi:hypothetical protein